MFYDNLKTICEKKGLKMTPIVIECGGAKGSISNWKKGASPNSDIVVALSVRLNVSTDFLLKGDNTQQIKSDNSVHAGDMTNSKIVTGGETHYTADDDVSIETRYAGIFKRLNKLPETKCYRAIADIIELLDERYQIE